MKNLKRLTILFVILALWIIIPKAVNGAEEFTYNDTDQAVEWTYELDSNENVVNLRLKTTSKTGEITIPSKIDGKTVTSLGEYLFYPEKNGAFGECTGITKVTIPETISKIPYKAFYKCSGLKELTIPNSITEIGDNAFEECSGIKSISFSNKLTKIGKGAFKNCSGLRAINMTDSITTIGEQSFLGCSGAKELKLSDNLTKIPQKAFEKCTGLTRVIIPDSVTTIEDGGYDFNGAFYKCTNLEKVLIPDSVSTIDKGAFDTNATKLTIYGNDGERSKSYAEENKFKFDYIANWDKQDSGEDVTPPTVDKIRIPYANIVEYTKDNNQNLWKIPAGAQLTINVYFSEVIQGTTAPTLTIRFGEGSNIDLTSGAIGGDIITYVYTIKDTDKGILTTVDLKGGNIKDGAGNLAVLSCPAVKIEIMSDDYVYANGTGNPNPTYTPKPTSSPTPTSTPTTTNTPMPTATPTPTPKATSTPTPTPTNKEKDDTTMNGKIPQTGENYIIITMIVTFMTVGFIAYIKSKE